MPRGTQETIVTRLISHAFQDTITIRLQHQQLFDLETAKFQMRYSEADKTLYPANDPNRRYESSLTLKGKTYSDVLVAKCPPCDNVSEIIFEKETGLVAYKLGDSYWTRK